MICRLMIECKRKPTQRSKVAGILGAMAAEDAGEGEGDVD